MASRLAKVFRRAKVWLWCGMAAVVLLPLAAHWGIRFVAALSPPEVRPHHVGMPAQEGGARVVGMNYERRRGRIREVRLVGSPEQIGAAHTRLLYQPMLLTERATWGVFEQHVTQSWARTLLLDLAQWRYRAVDEGMSPERKAEIASAARVFAPDPFTRYFPTYQRFVYLNAVYDIALSFEHSPLMGCTSFVFSWQRLRAGEGALLARNFDFELSDVFDREKVVFLVKETGKIPFASVGWPGFIGVVSGMNALGLALVVHGARAGPTRSEGEPVAHAMRRVLSEAETVGEAIRALSQRPTMVSHMVILADARGRAARVERIPGQPPFVRELVGARAVTNHLVGPGHDDPKNLRVKETTSSVARLARADELAAELHAAEPEHALALLRDRSAAGGAPLPAGDRKAIDAQIATHGVILETAPKVMWVSEGPHLLGRFIAFDLNELLGPHSSPPNFLVERSLSHDPLLEELTR